MSKDKPKTHIKVYVTKTGNFRARIVPGVERNLTDPGTVHKPPYEVSIGGESWAMGKGKEHIARIRSRIESILFSLIADYVNCVMDPPIGREETKIVFDFNNTTIRAERSKYV